MWVCSWNSQGCIENRWNIFHKYSTLYFIWILKYLDPEEKREDLGKEHEDLECQRQEEEARKKAEEEKKQKDEEAVAAALAKQEEEEEVKKREDEEIRRREEEELKKLEEARVSCIYFHKQNSYEMNFVGCNCVTYWISLFCLLKVRFYFTHIWRIYLDSGFKH